MGKTIEITCDGCGGDITYTGNSVDYRLVLESECKGIRPGISAVTDMMIYPPVERTNYFCNLRCLDHWTDRRHHRDMLSSEWRDQWKQEHGSKSGDGRVMSYPEPPREIQEVKAAEFDASALEAFPYLRKAAKALE